MATSHLASPEFGASKYCLACPNCRGLHAQSDLECPACGLVFAKWRGRGADTRPVFTESYRPSLANWIRARLRPAALLGLAGLFFWVRGRSLEIAPEDFNSEVLQARMPVLVMFDVAPFINCAPDQLRELRSEWKGRVSVVTLNAVAGPELGARYGVDKDPQVLLFEDGRLIKAANAGEMQRRVQARHGGSIDGADMKAELERFVRGF